MAFEHLNRGKFVSEAHLAAFKEGAAAARFRRKRCSTVSVDGPCADFAAFGTEWCRKHLGPKKYDDPEIFAEWLRRTKKKRGQAGVERVMRRRQKTLLHRAWKKDPTVPGKSCDFLTPEQEARARAFARREFRIDLDEADEQLPKLADFIRWRYVDVEIRGSRCPGDRDWPGCIQIINRMIEEGATKWNRFVRRDR